MGSDDSNARKPLSEQISDALLMRGSRPGVQQADRHRRHILAHQPVGQFDDLRFLQRLNHLAAVGDALGDLEAQAPRHKRHRLAIREVVEVGPVSPADLEHVPESPGRHQGR